MSKKLLAVMLVCIILFTFVSTGCEEGGMATSAYETPTPTMDPVTRAATTRSSAKYNFEQTVRALGLEQIVLYCSTSEEVTDELLIDSIKELYDGGVYIIGGVDELSAAVSNLAEEEYTVGSVSYKVMNPEYGFVGETSTRVMIIKSSARNERTLIQEHFESILYVQEGEPIYITATMNDEQFTEENILNLITETVGTPEGVAPFTVEIIDGYDDLKASFDATGDQRAVSGFIKLRVTCSQGDVFAIQAGLQITVDRPGFEGDTSTPEATPDATEDPGEDTTENPEESEAPAA